MRLLSVEERAEIRLQRRAARSPAEKAAEKRKREQRLKALLARYRECPACGLERSGPLHRTSRKLWDGRAERARRNSGTDPVSGVTVADAEQHLAAIAAAA